MRRHRLAVMLSGGMLGLLAGLALFAPVLGWALGLDAEAVDLFDRLGPPSADHPLGTDELGRDLLMRLLEGGRVSLAVGLSAAVAGSALGTIIGLSAGFVGGRLDDLLMRLADAVIALPLLPLLIVLAAVDLTKLGLSQQMAEAETTSLIRLVLLVALVSWPTTARLVRAQTLSLREREFVMAARSLGYGTGRIMLRHILPNTAAPILVAMTLAVGNVVLFESVLSFLGLGVRPPTPSWGNMLTGAQELIWQAPMQAVWPGLLIFLTVVSVNLLGDALRDILDPRTRQRRR
ncbi:MAG: ABC transporter permease [Alphaproteobacteria bacterium]|nr:ABC transporter permease [Alphaproteobacteria bacterium]